MPCDECGMAHTRSPRPIPTEDETLLDGAVRLYQPRYAQRLSREDAREIVSSLTGFFGVLRDWERRAAGQPVPGLPEPSEDER